jgi:hypothetical protein
MKLTTCLLVPRLHMREDPTLPTLPLDSEIKWHAKGKSNCPHKSLWLSQNLWGQIWSSNLTAGYQNNTLIVTTSKIMNTNTSGYTDVHGNKCVIKRTHSSRQHRNNICDKLAVENYAFLYWILFEIWQFVSNKFQMTFLQIMTQVTHQRYRPWNYSTLPSLLISLIKRWAYDNIASGCVMSEPTLPW